MEALLDAVVEARIVLPPAPDQQTLPQGQGTRLSHVGLPGQCGDLAD